jgi:transposase
LSVEQENLQMLGARIEQLKEMLHQETCRISMAQDSWVKDLLDTHITLLKKQIKETQVRILDIVNANPSLKETFDRLQSMKGVGLNTALALIIDLPELGYANKKQIAALVGVAPITKQSGQKTGKGFIQYGRTMVRRVLYMAALVASRHNAHMRTFYERLVTAGKPKKVALVAVMRKMIVTLNAMMQTKTCFQA